VASARPTRCSFPKAVRMGGDSGQGDGARRRARSQSRGAESSRPPSGLRLETRIGASSAHRDDGRPVTNTEAVMALVRKHSRRRGYSPRDRCGSDHDLVQAWRAREEAGSSTPAAHQSRSFGGCTRSPPAVTGVRELVASTSDRLSPRPAVFASGGSGLQFLEQPLERNRVKLEAK
jgi:hypothetical protein